jgi:hypothetical protein
MCDTNLSAFDRENFYCLFTFHGCDTVLVDTRSRSDGQTVEPREPVSPRDHRARRTDAATSPFAVVDVRERMRVSVALARPLVSPPFYLP